MVANEITECREYDPVNGTAMYRWDCGIYHYADGFHGHYEDEGAWVVGARDRATKKIGLMIEARRSQKMNDRDLLELAAKAAGYAIEWDEHYKLFRISSKHKTGRSFWEPLTNSDDGLLLTGVLGLRVSFDHDHENTEVCFYPEFKHKRRAGGVVEDWGSDRNAATLRAVVRAAASIAEQQ